jgi:hypothetical protein
MIESAPSFNILHSGSTDDDSRNLLKYIDRYAVGLGMDKIEVDEAALKSALTGMNNMPWGYGAQVASPFKKVASFATNFALHHPILTPFPEKHFGKFSAHQNAIIAYQVAVFSLHGATIECRFRGKLTLEKKITVSLHFWQEFISALSQSNPVEHFHFVSLMFESLSYEANPNVSYKDYAKTAMPSFVV